MATTLRALRPIYGRNNRPCRSTIERLLAKFVSTGTVQNVPVPVRQRSARSVENIVALGLQLKKAQMCLSHVVLKHWASLQRRYGEFWEMILAYILTKSN